MDINERIKRIRKKLKDEKIYYENLVEMTGISISTIKRFFENSNPNPKYNTLIKIEKALKIDEDQIADAYGYYNNILEKIGIDKQTADSFYQDDYNFLKYTVQNLKNRKKIIIPRI